MSTILRLRGLPFAATSEDITAFFKDYDTKAVYLGLRNGKPTGECYTEFETAEAAAKALKEKQHEHMGSRYIELFVAGEADLLALTSGGGGGGDEGDAPAVPSLLGHVVRLRGLPFNSTAQDVLQFLEGVDAVGGEGGVVFTCTPDGRPTGEAYVEVGSPEGLAAALERHKEKIGARYIEIFESSKGDMYQAVQQHGYFTTVGGRRRHHWHQQHAGGGGGMGGAAAAAAGGLFPPDAGGGGGRGRGSQMDQMQMQMDGMASAFAGFGLSQRDMQVPGPPRWGAYGAPADQQQQQQQQYQQYVGGAAAARQMQQAAVVAGQMSPGGLRWRPVAGQMHTQAGGGGMGQQHFNPAPGPPPGKGGRPGAPNGTRTQPGGGYGGSSDYGSSGGGQAGTMVFQPFMMQHPLMMQHHPQQQQVHGSPWGSAGMMQQQQQGGGGGGAWYGGMQMGGRAGMPMGMASPYSFTPAGFFPVRASGMSMSPQQMGGGGGGGHHQSQHHQQQQYSQHQLQHHHQQHSSSSRQQSQAAAAAATAAAASAAAGGSSHSLGATQGVTAAEAAAAAADAISGSQHSQPAVPIPKPEGTGSSGGGGDGAEEVGSSEEQQPPPVESPAAAAPAPATARPATPEQ